MWNKAFTFLSFSRVFSSATMARVFAVSMCAALANGQEVRSWSMSFGGGSWSSSSFMHSSSVTLGGDGRIHEEVHERHTEVSSDGEGVQRFRSKTHCADGLCAQEQTISAGPAAPGAGIRSAMRGFANLFASPPAAFHAPPPQPPMPPMLIVERVPPPPRPMLRGGPVIIEGMPFARGHGAQERPPIMIIDREHEVPTPPPPMTQGEMVRTMGDNTQLLEVFFAMSFVGSFAVTSFILVLKMLRGGEGKKEAREPRMKTLKQPLAPAQNKPLVSVEDFLRLNEPSAVVPPEEVAVSVAHDFLQGLYKEKSMTLAQREEADVQKYVSSLYQRVSA